MRNMGSRKPITTAECLPSSKKNNAEWPMPFGWRDAPAAPSGISSGSLSQRLSMPRSINYHTGSVKQLVQACRKCLRRYLPMMTAMRRKEEYSHWRWIRASTSRNVIRLRNEKKKTAPLGATSFKRVSEAGHFGDWELENLFNMANKWNRTNLAKFRQPTQKSEQKP